MGGGQLKKIKPHDSDGGSQPATVVSQPAAVRPATISAATVATDIGHMASKPSAPQQRPHVSLRTPGLTLKAGIARNEPKEAAVADDRHDRTSPYTAESLDAAWDAYIEANPTEHLIVNSMRSHRPVHIAGDTWQVTVDSESQAQIFRDAMPALLRHIHDSLQNDMLSFDIVLNRGQSAPVVWNEREVYQHMMATSEKMRNFVEAFKLTLI
ncbi:MAG TPA: hypothetical protein PLT34_04310 [Muribaculaceae bacterium]|nr:hypothetical protein [Muribaculaceae bacterium]